MDIKNWDFYQLFWLSNPLLFHHQFASFHVITTKHIVHLHKKQKSSVGLSPQANYTDWRPLVHLHTHKKNINKTTFVPVSPQANYTDWATGIGRWILMPTFSDRVVSRCQRGGTPTAVNLSFLDHSRYFFFQIAPHLCSRGWVDPVPDPLLLRKSGCSENRTRDL
jgi:hypothetical protein